LSRRALVVLTTVITIVWVANFVAGFWNLADQATAINGIFAIVVGVLYRSILKKTDDEKPDEQTAIDKPKTGGEGTP
jgi:hypothetical protein